MDVNAYLFYTCFMAICAWLIGLRSRMKILLEEARTELWQLPYTILFVVCTAYILMQMQFATLNIFQSLPAIITAVAAYSVAKKWPWLNSKSRWPLLGIIIVPCAFHILPRVGIALY